MLKTALVSAALLATLAISNSASAGHRPAPAPAPTVGVVINAGGVAIDLHTGLPVRAAPPPSRPEPKRVWVPGHWESRGKSHNRYWVEGHWEAR